MDYIAMRNKDMGEVITPHAPLSDLLKGLFVTTWISSHISREKHKSEEETINMTE